jgi:hypothetical protein
MPEYKRILGGEKNSKSGAKWSKEEIIEVYKLYKRINGVGLHEHNPEIQNLAGKLGRTVRSTEAQTLMFRNLERQGDYSHGRMNEFSKAVWNEFELKIVAPDDDHVKQPTPDESISYVRWNELLVQHFFNENFNNIEIGCFPVSTELFQEISDYDYSVEDFISSINQHLGGKNFLTKLQDVYKRSHFVEGGKSLRKKGGPEYFGYIIFLIYSLCEGKGDDISIDNVYDRINNFGSTTLGDKWSNVDTAVARETLEPIWSDLEYWSCSFLKGRLGLFKLHNPRNLNRIYVSRIERHALFNINQFRRVVDLLISDGFRSNTNVEIGEWIIFFEKHRNEIRNSGSILEFLKDDSSLREVVYSFLTNYLKKYFTEETISSESGTFRIPPKLLKLCIRQLPQWPREPVDEFYFRVVDEDLEEDTLSLNQVTIALKLAYKGISNEIRLDIDLNDGILIKGVKNRYTSNKRKYWLTKDHTLNEWVESDYPTNDRAFLIIISNDEFQKVDTTKIGTHSVFEIKETNFCVIKFSNLDEKQFESAYRIFNPYNKIEGKIELISSFTLDRRRCIFREFRPQFKYTGPHLCPALIAIDAGTKAVLCALEKEDENDTYTLPSSFDYEGEFQIREKLGDVKSRFNLYFGSLSVPSTNVANAFLKNQEGIYRSDAERNSEDILDIPHDFNRKFDITKFNTWHNNLFSLFKPSKKELSKVIFLDGSVLESKGDYFLQYISINSNITTNEFPKLIRELDPKVSQRYSKQILFYWRMLGYIDFQDFGGNVKVCSTSLLFLQSETGLRGYLTGYRDPAILRKIILFCKNHSIKVEIKSHSEYFGELYPSQIILNETNGDLKKFHKLKSEIGLSFLNDIQNPYHPSYVVYQLACLYTQKSVNEFVSELGARTSYPTDHHRKRIYNLSTLNWDDSTEDISNIPDKAIIRYDGFSDNSMTHVIRYSGSSKMLSEINLPIFSVMTANVLLKRRIEDSSRFNLLIPYFLGFPFWIEKGLILLNSTIPKVTRVEGTSYREYVQVENKILEVIETKLNQKIIEI